MAYDPDLVSRLDLTCVPGPSALGGSRTTTSPAFRPARHLNGVGHFDAHRDVAPLGFAADDDERLRVRRIGAVAHERRGRHDEASGHVAHLYLARARTARTPAAAVRARGR